MNKLCITSNRAAATGEQLFARASAVKCARIACTRQLATLRLNSITTFSLFIYLFRHNSKLVINTSITKKCCRRA